MPNATSTETLTALSIDWDYDADRASPGPSRYGKYLSSRLGEVAEAMEWSPPVSWLATIYRIATPPVLGGLVRPASPAVFSSSIERDEWDGGALGRLTIACLPRLEAGARLPGCRSWSRSFSGFLVEEPDARASVGRARPTTLLATAELVFPIDTEAAKRVATAEPGRLLAAARSALIDAVDQINAAAAPVLAALVEP